MNPFQAVANWIQKQKTPGWLRELFQEIEFIIITSINNLAKEYLAQIEAKIIEVNGQYIPNKEKFQRVFDFCRAIGIVASETILNILINALVLKLKNRRAI